MEEKEHEVDTNIALLDNPEVSGYDFYFIKDLFLNNKITDLSLSEYIFHQTKEGKSSFYMFAEFNLEICDGNCYLFSHLFYVD